VDPLRAYGEDKTYLIAAPTAGPLVGGAEVPLGELFDVLGTTIGGDVDYLSANRVVASRVVRVRDGNGHARIALDVANLLETLDGVDQGVLAVGIDPGLGELGRAVGHRRGYITGTRLA
jgi:hypothetical protein